MFSFFKLAHLRPIFQHFQAIYDAQLTSNLGNKELYSISFIYRFWNSKSIIVGVVI